MKKLSIVCFSGEFDKAVAAFTMASGAAAVSYEVNLFFTQFNGVPACRDNPLDRLMVFPGRRAERHYFPAPWFAEPVGKFVQE